MELKSLSSTQKKELIIKLLAEQVVDQRRKLHFWRELTKQAAQIDTGYIVQHLVSLVTSLPGCSMRGKGEDLENGAEIKSANFLDSLDKRGAVAPRWNFSSNNLPTMESYLEVPAIYLASLDLNPSGLFRARIWKMNPKQHKVFNSRYREWMEKLGKPKLQDPRRPGVNFQLFPPRNRTNESFARHGRGRLGGFTRIKIELENTKGSKKILHAEESDGGIVILHLDTD
jgi:hypothetical protein